MRRNENLEELLKGSLPSASREQAESAGSRVFERLRSESGRLQSPPIIDPAPHRRWPWAPVTAAAAAVVLVSWLGVTWRGDKPLATAVVGAGSLSQIIGAEARTLEEGAEIAGGETIRAAADGAALRLADGSGIEMRAKAELKLEPLEDGVRILLTRGSVIVNAAKQPAGRHLYVRTKDVTVAVVGTVFLVNAEESGSRVAVIEGEVRVQQDGIETKLLPGQQLTVATSSAMPSASIAEEVRWSGQAESHMAMLQQAPAPPASSPQAPKWEVTSVRQCTGDQPGNARGGGNGAAPSPGAMGTSPGLLRITCMPLKWLIERAYVKYLESDMKPTWFFPISGGPSWIDSDLYTILAKTEDLPSEQEMRGPMLQALLEERFNLKMRREVREEPVYELRVSEAGLRIQPLKEGECAARDEKAEEVRKTTGELLGVWTEGARRIFPCGAQTIGGPQDGTTAPPRTRTVNVFGGGLDLLTRNLSLDRIIIDKTGLEGRFDMQLTYSIDKSPMRNPQPVTAEPPGGDSIFVAIEKQLGLELVPIDGPRTYYTIEHVDRPSEN